ncbi:uncharacterized protein [Diadema setosum]|uniref:uncharacterized protein n=1 Tax=Diadema setosum TaxID=31175 RepID=UPI003B3A4B8A
MSKSAETQFDNLALRREVATRKKTEVAIFMESLRKKAVHAKIEKMRKHSPIEIWNDLLGDFGDFDKNCLVSMSKSFQLFIRTAAIQTDKCCLTSVLYFLSGSLTAAEDFCLLLEQAGIDSSHCARWASDMPLPRVSPPVVFIVLTSTCSITKSDDSPAQMVVGINVIGDFHLLNTHFNTLMQASRQIIIIWIFSQCGSIFSSLSTAIMMAGMEKTTQPGSLKMDDFKPARIHQYLAALIRGKEPPRLTPLESQIVLDCFQHLIEKLKESEIKNQMTFLRSQYTTLCKKAFKGRAPFKGEYFVDIASSEATRLLAEGGDLLPNASISQEDQPGTSHTGAGDSAGAGTHEDVASSPQGSTSWRGKFDECLEALMLNPLCIPEDLLDLMPREKLDEPEEKRNCDEGATDQARVETAHSSEDHQEEDAVDDDDYDDISATQGHVVSGQNGSGDTCAAESSDAVKNHGNMAVDVCVTDKDSHACSNGSEPTGDGEPQVTAAQAGQDHATQEEFGRQDDDQFEPMLLEEDGTNEVATAADLALADTQSDPAMPAISATCLDEIDNSLPQMDRPKSLLGQEPSGLDCEQVVQVSSGGDSSGVEPLDGNLPNVNQFIEPPQIPVMTVPPPVTGNVGGVPQSCNILDLIPSRQTFASCSQVGPVLPASLSQPGQCLAAGGLPLAGSVGFQNVVPTVAPPLQPFMAPNIIQQVNPLLQPAAPIISMFSGGVLGESAGQLLRINLSHLGPNSNIVIPASALPGGIITVKAPEVPTNIVPIPQEPAPSGNDTPFQSEAIPDPGEISQPCSTSLPKPPNTSVASSPTEQTENDFSLSVQQEPVACDGNLGDSLSDVMQVQSAAPTPVVQQPSIVSPLCPSPDSDMQASLSSGSHSASANTVTSTSCNDRAPISHIVDTPGVSQTCTELPIALQDTSTNLPIVSEDASTELPIASQNTSTTSDPCVSRSELNAALSPTGEVMTEIPQTEKLMVEGAETDTTTSDPCVSRSELNAALPPTAEVMTEMPQTEKLMVEGAEIDTTTSEPCASRSELNAALPPTAEVMTEMPQTDKLMVEGAETDTAVPSDDSSQKNAEMVTLQSNTDIDSSVAVTTLTYSLEDDVVPVDALPMEVGTATGGDSEQDPAGQESQELGAALATEDSILDTATPMTDSSPEHAGTPLERSLMPIPASSACTESSQAHDIEANVGVTASEPSLSLAALPMDHTYYKTHSECQVEEECPKEKECPKETEYPLEDPASGKSFPTDANILSLAAYEDHFLYKSPLSKQNAPEGDLLSSVVDTNSLARKISSPARTSSASLESHTSTLDKFCSSHVLSPTKTDVINSRVKQTDDNVTRSKNIASGLEKFIVLPWSVKALERKDQQWRKLQESKCQPKIVPSSLQESPAGEGMSQVGGRQQIDESSNIRPDKVVTKEPNKVGGADGCTIQVEGEKHNSPSGNLSSSDASSGEPLKRKRGRPRKKDQQMGKVQDCEGQLKLAPLSFGERSTEEGISQVEGHQQISESSNKVHDKGLEKKTGKEVLVNKVDGTDECAIQVEAEKHENPSGDFSLSDASSCELLKCKRGRPPKKQQARDSGSPSVEGEPPKRKRGRPPKKNQQRRNLQDSEGHPEVTLSPLLESTTTEDMSPMEGHQQSDESSNIRPDKVVTKEPKKVGGADGYAIQVEAEKPNNPSSGSLSWSDASSGESQKRKRGRPPKKQQASDSGLPSTEGECMHQSYPVSQSKNIAAAAVQVRKRGRPPKTGRIGEKDPAHNTRLPAEEGVTLVLPKSPLQIHVIKSGTNATDVPPHMEAQKRGRGRPPKRRREGGDDPSDLHGLTNPSQSNNTLVSDTKLKLKGTPDRGEVPGMPKRKRGRPPKSKNEDHSNLPNTSTCTATRPKVSGNRGTEQILKAGNSKKSGSPLKIRMPFQSPALPSPHAAGPSGTSREWYKSSHGQGTGHILKGGRRVADSLKKSGSPLMVRLSLQSPVSPTPRAASQSVMDSRRATARNVTTGKPSVPEVKGASTTSVKSGLESPPRKTTVFFSLKKTK